MSLFVRIRQLLLNKIDMLYTKEKALVQVNKAVIVQFLFLTGLASVMPFYIHVQWITGPIINAILLITLFLLGIRSAFLVCLIPSLMAFSGGLLPPVLAPVIPFIMIGNIIYVMVTEFVYNYFKDNYKGFFVGFVSGSILKFIFLFLSVNLIGKLLIKQELIFKVAQMMSWTQLVTALSGGMIAFVILKWLKRI